MLFFLVSGAQHMYRQIDLGPKMVESECADQSQKPTDISSETRKYFILTYFYLPFILCFISRYVPT